MRAILWPGVIGDDPAVHTIAHYKRDNPTTHAVGSLIAVSEAYTCYAIRSGLIRAIHRATEATVLLRGLTHDVTDMNFAPRVWSPSQQSHAVLAAVSTDGRVVCWSLKAVNGTIECAGAPLVTPHASAAPPRPHEPRPCRPWQLPPPPRRYHCRIPVRA